MKHLTKLELDIHNNTATDVQLLAYCVRRTLMGRVLMLDKSGDVPTYEQSRFLSRLLTLLHKLDGSSGSNEQPDDPYQ